MALIGLVVAGLGDGLQGQPVVQWWASSEDLRQKLAPQPELKFQAGPSDVRQALRVDASVTFQTVLGLGGSLEHSTCYNLSRLPADRREQVLASLVDPDRGIGMNLMRICIGTSDFAPLPFYTYDDMPPGGRDPELKHFSIARDREYVLPILREAKRLNPRLKFFAAPWSPPAWMKTNGRIGGGRMKRENDRCFAEYLARFVEAYRDEGIEVHALTVQNEPEFNPESYPTCAWSAKEQRDFIRDHLGPVFESRQLSTLIWCFDHNFNNPGFPATILSDSRAARYVEGSAFHLYEGKPGAMSKLHREFPGKSIYFTEGSVYGMEGAREIIAYFRNWARSYNAWVTLIDHRLQPNSGPHDCDPTCVVLNADTLQVDYRFDYAMYGQFMKFIQPGAVRLASTESSRLPSNVAFRNPDGRIVLVAANADPRPRPFSVAWNELSFSVSLQPQTIATFTWSP